MKTYIWCFKWLFLLVLNPLHAYGQDYPSKPVYLVVPFAPGGGADILARFIGQGLSMSLGKPVLVDNRSGGGGNIGANYVAKATPDGYTLLVAGIPQAIGMSLYGKLPYDLAADLMPITQAATFANIIVVHPSLPVKSIKELLTLARKKPGELNYGANPGSPNHLGMELMGVKLNHISYRGSGQVLTELLSGQIQLAGLSFPVSLPFVQSGRLRAIAVTSEQRSPVLPNVPTVTEAGIPGYVVTSWFGVFAPTNTPRNIISKLNSEIISVLKKQEITKKLNAMGADVATTTPDEFGKIVRDEIKRWAKVIQATGVKSN